MMKIFFLWMMPLLLAAEPVLKNEPKEKFLTNGQVKIGLDLSSGGSIFWFSEFPGDRNLLNHHDRGRFIQQSYYGEADGSMWAKKPWRWNPVQGGDYKGKPARVLEIKETQSGIYVKSIPVNWAGGEELEDCRMEEWVSLEGNVAKIRFRFTYRGKIQHAPRHQELPAVFVDYDLPNLVYYTGNKPWTGEGLKKDVPGWPNELRTVDEEWAGFVGADGKGLGVYFPGTSKLTCYRHSGPPGPKGGGCSYFAPIQTIAIKPGFVHDYTIHLTLGTADEMRSRFGAIRAARKP